MVGDRERSAFSGRHVLRLVETVCGKQAEGAERTAAVLPEEPVRVVLDHRRAYATRRLADRIELARHACVVRGNDRLGPRAGERLDLCLVEVESVRTHV